MARFIKGDVVIIPFPFSDLSGSKRRPAFVIASQLLFHLLILHQARFRLKVISVQTGYLQQITKSFFAKQDQQNLLFQLQL